MKTIFKTALVAAAIATATGSAYAGDTIVTTQTHSLEAVSSITTDQTSASISYVTKAAYTDGDKVTFTFTAGAVTGTTFPAQLNVPADTTSGSEKAGMALGLLNTTADSVTYRVTSLSQPGAFTDKTTLGQTIVLGTVTLKAAAVAAGNVLVTVSSATSAGDVLDSGSSTGQSRTAKLTQVKTQFGKVSVASTAGFDGVVDVAADRKALVGVSSDTATFTISQVDTTGWITVAPVNATTVTLNADLAGMTSAAISTGSGTATYSDANKQVTVAYASQVTTDTITITPPTGTSAVVLGAQDFSLAANYTYSTNKTALLGSAAAGEWTLNGAMVNIPYMPYGPTVSQIMYVTNEGSLDADVNVTAFDDKGNSYDLGVVAVAKATAVTKLTAQIQAGLAAAGFTSGKVSITVTVNAQDKDITVYSAYNAGSTRGGVATSQYKGK